MSNPVTGNNISQCVVSVNATAKLVGSRVGYRIFHKHPPPLDIVRVTSSALRKIEKHPHSWTFTSTPPPWTLPVWRHPHSKGGAGWSPLSHTHPGSATGVHLRSTSKKGGSKRGSNFGPNVKKAYIVAQNGGGSGGPDPLDPPPLDPPLGSPLATSRDGSKSFFASPSQVTSHFLASPSQVTSHFRASPSQVTSHLVRRQVKSSHKSFGPNTSQVTSLFAQVQVKSHIISSTPVIRRGI